MTTPGTGCLAQPAQNMLRKVAAHEARGLPVCSMHEVRSGNVQGPSCGLLLSQQKLLPPSSCHDVFDTT